MNYKPEEISKEQIKPTGDYSYMLEKLGVLKAHDHRFTIPVEWKYEVVSTKDYDNYPAGTAIGKHVTKLRCSGCGEEKERK